MRRPESGQFPPSKKELEHNSYLTEPLEPRRYLSVLFQQQPAYAVGSYAKSVAVADVNGDGRLDVITANGLSNNISILLGNGDGTFAPQQTFAVPAYPTSVAVGDVNGDGKPDLVVADGGSKTNPGYTVSVLLGNGDGTFGSAQTFAAGERPLFVAIADVNGDQNPDLIVADAGTPTSPGDTVSVLLGNGNGTFQAQQTFAVGMGPYSLAVGDLNGDGQLDLAVANYDDGDLSVLLGNGNGTFQTQQTYAAGLGADSIVIAKFDGNFDLAVADGGTKQNSGDTVSILLGNGNGTFQPQATLSAGLRPSALVAGDFNGDGDQDLGVADSSTGTVGLFLGNGNGTFLASGGSYTVGGKPYSMATGDFAGDGIDDLVTANKSSNSVSILLGVSPPGFSSNTGPSISFAGHTQSRPHSIAVADFNSDGNPDLAVADQNNGDVAVMLGNGNGTFGAATTFAVGQSPYSVVAADFNGDGNMDLAVTNYGSSTVSILLGNGNGTFAAQQTLALSAGADPTSVAALDLNGDGNIDLLVANEHGGSVSIFLGNGNGTFLRIPGVPLAANPFFLETGDFNGDGTPDFVVDQYYGNSLEVFLGTGNGNFQESQELQVGSRPKSMAVGDFNGDGILDLAVANYTAGTVSIFLGNGNGTFAPQETVAVGPQPFSLVAADFNGDGITDLAVSNNGAKTGYGDVGILLGNGSGTFQPQITIGHPYTRPRSIASGDFNGDGKPDLVVTLAGGATHVLLNNVSSPPLLSFLPLTAGTLTVDAIGGRSDDVIVSLAHGVLTISDHGVARSIPSAGISQIILNTGDGGDVVTVEPEVNIPVSVIGGAGDDTLIAADQNDTLAGSGGNDSLTGEGSADLLIGGGGGDTLIGESAAQTLAAGPGNDSVNGDGGTLLGGSGDDTVRANGAGAVAAGGAGDDVLLALGSADTASGGIGNDTIVCGSTLESLLGGPGDDVFLNSSGSDDSIDGGTDLNFEQVVVPSDSVVNVLEALDPGVTAAPQVAMPFDVENGVLIVRGTAAADSISLTLQSGDLVATVDGAAQTPVSPASLTGILIIGSTGPDTISVDPSVLLPVTLKGGGGGDSLTAGGGDADLVGGGGSDTLVGGDGNNDLVPGPLTPTGAPNGSDLLIGGPAGTENYADFSERTDNLYLTNNGLPDSGDTAAGEATTIMPSVQNIFAGSGNVTIVSTTPGSFLSAGVGEDLLVSGGANTSLVAGPNLPGTGSDSVAASGGTNHMFLQNGNPDDYEGVGPTDFLLIDPAPTDVATNFPS